MGNSVLGSGVEWSGVELSEDKIGVTHPENLR